MVILLAPHMRQPLVSSAGELSSEGCDQDMSSAVSAVTQDGQLSSECGDSRCEFKNSAVHALPTFIPCRMPYFLLLSTLEICSTALKGGCKSEDIHP